MIQPRHMEVKNAKVHQFTTRDVITVNVHNTVVGHCGRPGVPVPYHAVKVQGSGQENVTVQDHCLGATNVWDQIQTHRHADYQYHALFTESGQNGLTLVDVLVRRAVKDSNDDPGVAQTRHPSLGVGPVGGICRTVEYASTIMIVLVHMIPIGANGTNGPLVQQLVPV